MSTHRGGGIAAAAWAVALVLALMVAPAALAQTETGKIVGAVSDQSGGVLPGATVTVKSLATGATRSAVTDSNGSYVFAALPPGPYEITMELTGFTTRQVKTTLTVGAVASVEAKLEVGVQTEVITVVGSAEGVTVNTATQEVATTVSEKQLKELPSLTRNPYDFVALSGNASPGDVANDSSTTQGAGFSLNGQRTASTNVLLDGSANNDEFGAAIGQNVPLDSVQEFSVISSNFSAQFGRASGGIVNVATKSGSNALHGTAYEYFRPGGLAAADVDDKAHDLPKADFTRHQPGFSLGGPLQKDKAFFFVSYEYTNVDSTKPVHFAVPTPELIARTSPNVQEFFSGNPANAAPSINGGTITVGQVCASIGCSAGGPFSNLDPNLPAFGVVNFTAPVDGGAGAQQKHHQAVARLDFNLSASTTAYLRYAFEKQDLADGWISLSPYSAYNTGQELKNHNMLGSITHIFSPSLTSQTKLVYNNLTNNQPVGAAGISPAMYLNGGPVNLLGNLVVFPGYIPTSSGLGVPFGGPQKLFQAYEDVNWVKGAHDLRFGGSYVRIMDNRDFAAYQEATENLGFGDATLGLDNLMTGNAGLFAVAINPKVFPGQGLVQLPAEQGPSQFHRDNRYNEYAAYFNDSWSVSSRLKLNLGVRWELFGVQHNADPTLDSNFYFGQGDNFFQQFRSGSLRTANDTSTPGTLGQTGINDLGQIWASDRNNFAPRVGFAYDVRGDGKTSIRGGYGIGFERNFGNVTFNIIQNPPNNGTAQLFDVPVSVNNLGPLGEPGDPVAVAFSLRHVDQDIKTAYAHFWSASIQHEVAKNTVVSIDYTGSKGVDLYSLGNVNARGTAKIYAGQLGLDPASVPASARLNPLYGSDNMRTNNGRSAYNAVNFGVEGRSIGSSGLSLTAHYTWAKSKDNLSSTFSSGIGQSHHLGFTDPYVGGVGGGPDLDYGYSDYDVRHRGVVSGIWEIPLAKGATGATKAVLGGWSFNFLFQAHSGTPFTLYDCSNIGNSGAPCPRLATANIPVENHNGAVVADSPNSFTYLDLSQQGSAVGCYTNPIVGYSTIGPFPSAADTRGCPGPMTDRNQFRGPGNWRLDATLAKRFQLSDKVNLQLRAEAYNVFNHSNLFVDGSTLDVSSNSFVRSYRGSGGGTLLPLEHRNIQLAARLSW